MAASISLNGSGLARSGSTSSSEAALGLPGRCGRAHGVILLQAALLRNGIHAPVASKVEADESPGRPIRLTRMRPRKTELEYLFVRKETGCRLRTRNSRLRKLVT